MTQIIMDDDMKFIQDLFKKFVPAVVSSDGRRRCKRPIFTGWLNVTAEESVELARCTEYKDGPFIFLTGKATKYIAVDLDIKDMLRKDHANKHDGVSYYTNRFGELEYVKNAADKHAKWRVPPCVQVRGWDQKRAIREGCANRYTIRQERHVLWPRIRDSKQDYAIVSAKRACTADIQCPEQH